MESRLVIAAVLVPALLSCAAREHGHSDELRVSRLALGTLVEISVRDPRPARARRAIERGFAEVERLEALLSDWREESEISALNRAAGGGWVPLSEETAEALSRALEIAELTGGAFDPTVGPLLRAWGFAGGDPRVPSEDELRRLRARVGFERVQLDRERRRARLPRRGMAVSLGGIGKGFVADAVLEQLRGEGIRAAMVAAGGDLAFYGGSAERPWRIAVEDPERPGTVLAEFDRLAGAVSTSAPTYRFFEAGSLRFHHILDPRTGRPARGLRSLTLVADTAVRSDGLSTGLFVLGDRALGWAERRGLELVVLFEDGRRVASPGLGVRWLVAP